MRTSETVPLRGGVEGLAESLREVAAEGYGLADDLSASWAADDVTASVEAWLTRPSTLAGVARRLAELVPAGTDRLVGMGPGAETLTAGVALLAGIPPATVRQTSAGQMQWWGPVRPGDAAVAVTAVLSPSSAAGLQELAATRGIQLTAVLAVVAVEAAWPQDAVPRCEVLFEPSELEGARGVHG